MREGNDFSAAPPLFILSSARSGSTLMRYIVDTHPAICSPGELNFGPLCERLYWAVYDTLGQVAPVSEEQERSGVALTEVRRILMNLMRPYAAARKKAMWCEKSPINIVYTQIIDLVFPEAKYICLHRNSLDVVHSCLEFSSTRFVEEFEPYFRQFPSSPISGLISYWIDRTTKLLSFESRKKAKCYRIKYESLVTEPAQCLPLLFEFLGLEMDSKLLDRVFDSFHDKGDGDPKTAYTQGISKRSIGKGARMELSSVPEDLLLQMNRLMLELGYPSVQNSPSLSSCGWTPDSATNILHVTEVFNYYIPTRLNKQIKVFHGITAIYKIIATGEDGGVWAISFNLGTYEIRTGDFSSDCTITLSARTVVDIVNERVNVIEACDSGEILVEGDAFLAELLGKVLFGMPGVGRVEGVPSRPVRRAKPTAV